MMANNYYQENPDYISQLIELPRGISRLEELGILMSYSKNQIILEAGEIPKYCYVVKRGCVAGFEYTLGGQERIYTLNERNSVILESSLIMNYETPVSFKAIESTDLIAIDRPTLMNMISSDPEIAMDILQSVSIKFLSTMEQLRHTNYHSAEWKICDLLLDLARKYGIPYDDKILIKEKISQQMISNLLGINRITAVRAIKDLKTMGLIESINGYYCIRDINRLKRHQNWLLSSMENK